MLNEDILRPFMRGVFNFVWLGCLKHRLLGVFLVLRLAPHCDINQIIEFELLLNCFINLKFNKKTLFVWFLRLFSNLTQPYVTCCMQVLQ